MDAIRKKMHQMKVDTEHFNEVSKRYETQATEMNAAADKNDLLTRDLGKKISHLEGSLDTVIESFKKTTADLEEKEKTLDTVEDEVNALSRKTTLMEVEAREAEARMGEVVLSTANKSREADNIHRKVKYFETKNMRNEMTIEDQEKDLREASIMVRDSDIKLVEITRKLGMTEDELRRAVERAELADANLVKVEDDLRMVGENMILLEVSEEKAMGRVEKLKETLKSLMLRLKEAEKRAEYGEMNITKLNIRIDDIEDEIVREKLKIQKLGDEVGAAFDDILNKY